MKNGLIILLILVSAGQNLAQTETTHYFDSVFSMYNHQTPGVAVAVVQNGKTLFQKGYGMANLEYDVPINTQTVFHIASVSKQFTAFCIYLLEVQGKISFADDIRQYLPELPDYGDTITLQHLLAHTSGIKDQWALLTLAGWQMEDVITTGQILRLVAKQKSLNFPPGTQFLYSNTGYTLLAEIIHRVTGQSFPEFVSKNIFEPLEMHHSQFYNDFHKVVKNRAYSYERQSGEYLKKKLNYATTGATSLLTTVEDMAKWAQNFVNPKVGTPELLESFNAISSLNDGSPVIWSAAPGDTTYHAKGQLHYFYEGLKVISHGGHDAGYRAGLSRFPEHNFAIIMLSNDEHYNIFGNMSKIANFFLKDHFKTTEPIPSPIVKTPEAPKPFFNQLQDYPGRFESVELNTAYNIKIQYDTLVLTHSRLEDIKLEQTGKDQFKGVHTFPVEINFIRGQNGVSGFTISNFGAKNLWFEKTRNFDANESILSPVVAQLEAYNNRNISEFLEPYSDNIKLYNFPNQQFGAGKEFMRRIYAGLFANSPRLNCKIINRTVLGNTVIDHEMVSGMNGDNAIQAIAIYKILNGKIEEVYFIR